jgi:hypothetical protein
MVGAVRVGEDAVIVHKGDLDRHTGLEVGQGATQDAISQRRASQLAGRMARCTWRRSQVSAMAAGPVPGPAKRRPAARACDPRQLINELAAAEPD